MGRQLKILVADSEPDFVKMAKEAMESKGYQVATTSSRKEGIEKAKREGPDLVIVGALEPRGDAFKLHREFRDNPQTAHIPILVVDVRPEDHSRKGWRRDEGFQMDAEDYVTRPLKPFELVECVERVLESVAIPKPVELAYVLERLEKISCRIERIEKSLIK